MRKYNEHGVINLTYEYKEIRYACKLWTKDCFHGSFCVFLEKIIKKEVGNEYS